MEKKRWCVIADLIKNKPHKIGAEIGGWKGHTTKRILELVPTIEKYYVIDPWELYVEYEKSLDPRGDFAKMVKDMENVFNEFKKRVRPYKSKIEIMKMFSSEAVKNIPDESLDFIFIDGNHAYEYVKEDIVNWIPKVKMGGLISGHDYDRRDGTNLEVQKAVDEMLKKVNKGDNYVWWLWKKENILNDNSQ